MVPPYGGSMWTIGVWAKSAISDNFVLVPRWLWEQAEEYVNVLNGKTMKVWRDGVAEGGEVVTSIRL
jgi:hypothetical protein